MRNWAAVLLPLCLAACAGGPSAAPQEGPTARPDATTPIPTATVTSLPTASPSPWPTSEPTEPPPCQRSGRVARGAVPDGGFGRELPYSIYLPGCEPGSGSQFPSIILLHGLAGDDGQWLAVGVQGAADELIQAGAIPPVAIVLPWQRTGVELEPAIIEGLLPHVSSHYPVEPRGARRAIGGLSRGGGWAFRLALKHPRQFSALGMHSPGLLAGDLFAVERWLEADPDAPFPRIWIDIGDRDNLSEEAVAVEARLEELSLNADFHLGEGRHELAYWQMNVRDYLRWYAREW